MTARHRAAPDRQRGSWLCVVCVLAGLSLLMASRLDPPTAVTLDARSQVEALLRVVSTSLVAAAALLGPGLVLRARWHRCADLPLAFVPLIGLTWLVAVGGACWVTARHLDPHLTALVGVLVVLIATAAAGWRAGPVLERAEGRVLVVAGLVFLFAIGRSLWSPGPDGELFTGMISRTLEVGDRPDSRISYHVTTLVAHGLSPYGTMGASLFSPYSFLDRGPLPGLASAAVMLAVGTTPAEALPDQPWSVFDVQGFMAYRVVMMLLALMSVLAVYSLVHALAGPARAHLAVLVAATTPFVVHEVYFTWPKLAAAALSLVAAHAILRRRFVAAGVLAGVGVLMHPLALLATPTLGLLIVLIETVSSRRSGARVPARQVLVAIGRLALGLAALVGTWRLINLGRPTKGGFVGYVLDADAGTPSSFADWLSSRGTSVANTLVPLYRLLDPDDPSINSIYAPSGPVVHFFFQYWTGLPFGIGIVFFPILVLGLVRAARRMPVTVLLLVVLPFVGFAVYWGGYDSGLLREGLHPWVLTLVVVWALTWPSRAHTGGVGLVVRAILAARVLGVLAWALVPTVSSLHALTSPDHGLADACALAAMVVAAAALALLTLRAGERLEPWTGDVSAAAPHP